MAKIGVYNGSWFVSGTKCGKKTKQEQIERHLEHIIWQIIPFRESDGGAADSPSFVIVELAVLDAGLEALHGVLHGRRGHVLRRRRRHCGRRAGKRERETFFKGQYAAVTTRDSPHAPPPPSVESKRHLGAKESSG